MADDDQVCVDLSLCLVEHLERIRLLVAARMGPRVASWASVEDFVDDVIVESLAQAGEFRYVGEARFVRWISTVTQRVVADAIQRGRREPPALSIQNAAPSDSVVRPSQVPDSMRTPSSILALEEGCERLIMALAALRESDREIIRMVHLEERTLDDVSAELGCSTKAAAKRSARALRRLRTELEARSHDINS